MGFFIIFKLESFNSWFINGISKSFPLCAIIGESFKKFKKSGAISLNNFLSFKNSSDMPCCSNALVLLSLWGFTNVW